MIKGFTKVSLEIVNVFTIFYTNSFIKTLTSWWHLMKHQGVTKVIIWFYLLGALDLSAWLNNQLENHISRYKIFGMLPIIWHTFASRSNYTLSISCRLEPIHHPLTQPDPLRVITGGLLRLDNPTWKQITSSWGSWATAARQWTTRCPSFTVLQLRVSPGCLQLSDETEKLKVVELWAVGETEFQSVIHSFTF